MRLGGEVANKGCGIKSVTTACRRLNPAFEGAEVFIHPLHQLSVEGYFLQVGQNSLSLLDSNGQRKFLGKELQVL